MNYKKTFWFMGIFALMLILAACGGGSESAAESTTDDGPKPREEAAVELAAGDPDVGKEQYDQLCIACHGPGGEGIEGLGKPFTTSEFLSDTSDADMLEFIKVGRPSGDPLNTTGIDMPPKGGNPALTDEQILDIVAFVRTLHE